MECTHAKELLSVYVFDEIESGDRQRLESHLQVCGACTRNLENFRVVREALSELPVPEVPGDFLVGVRARLEQPVTFMDRVDEALAAFSGRRMAAGASVALAAGFAFLVGNTSGDLSAPPVASQALRQESDALAPSGARGAGKTAPTLATVLGEADEEELEKGAADFADAGSVPEGKPAEGAVPDRQTRSEATGSLRAAAPRKPTSVPVPEPVARRSAADSFDDVFGEPDSEAPAAAAPPPPPPAAPVADRAPTRVARRPRASAAAQPPSSPFLERKFAQAKNKKRAPARALSSMGANELGQELARLEESRSRTRRVRSVESDLSIFAPEDLDAGYADDEASLGEDFDPASAGFAADARDAFGGGTGLARVSDGDPFDSGASRGPGRGDLFADAPRVPPVTIAFLRTTFGRSVDVLQPTQVSRFPAQVGRDLGLRSRDPRGAIQGIHSLLEAGLGLELQGVEMRQGEEVTLLISLASGPSGRQALDRFVEDLRGLAGTALASDVASVNGGDLGRLARISIPTP